MARRGRWAVRGLVGGAVLLLLLGRGWSWWDGAGSGQDGDEPGDASARAAPISALAADQAAVELRPGGQARVMDAPKGSDPGHRGRRRPRDGSDDGSDATLRPGQVGSARAGGIGLASADPGELSRQSIVDDPRRARLAAIRSALAEARLGAASSAIERLRRDGSALTEFSELAGQVERRVAGACVSLAAHLQAGEVLRARALLRELLEPSSPATIAAVERVCAEHGWPSLTGEPVQHAIVGADAVPTWRGLKDGRVVRAVRGGETVRTRIVAATDNGITLRVVGRDGVTFPTVAAWTVEPEAVKAAEAAELGLAALAVGAQRYARLWCVCGLLRASQPVPRLDLLRQLLR